MVIVIISAISCKKDGSEIMNPNTPTDSGMLLLHIHTFVDNVEVDNYDSVYVLSDGRKIIVSIAQLYLSNFSLVKLDGSEQGIDNKVVLLKQDANAYLVGNVPAGNYKSIKFNVGLPSSVNASMPGDNYELNQPSMWFDSVPKASGYKFLLFEGLIDTSSTINPHNSQLQPYAYSIGTDFNNVSISLPDQLFSILPNALTTFHFAADYNKLFDGLNMSDSTNLKMNSIIDNGTELGKQITNNIATMFLL